MGGETTQRLFFALWPDDAVCEALEALALCHAGDQGKRIRTENLHITLVFLGNVDARRRCCLEEAADAVGGRSFTLWMDTLGWWPRPQVLWVGPTEIPAALLNLVGALKLACQGCGLEPERRPYQAHLTLARKVRRARLPRSIEPIQWPIKSFALVESKTLSTGAEYSVLRTWSLG